MKVTLKLKIKVPKKYMKLGRHKVGLIFKTYDLNKEEIEQLKSIKGKAAFVTKDQYEKNKAKKKKDNEEK